MARNAQEPHHRSEEGVSGTLGTTPIKHFAVLIASVVRLGESETGPVAGSGSTSPVRSVTSTSESVAAAPSLAPVRREVGLKHGAGAAVSGDQLPESASSAIGGTNQPRLWSPAAVWIRQSSVAQQVMMPSATSRRFMR